MLVLWLLRDHAAPPDSTASTGATDAADAVQPTRTASPTPRPPALRDEDERLYDLLDEHVEYLEADVRIDRIELERPSVCAGESLRVSARLDGRLERGLVTRWVWLRDEAFGLEPGTTMSWSAPATPGSYRLRFQVCRDLGDRRVGIVAERVANIEVRACEPGERAADAPLRIVARRTAPDTFHFLAAVTGGRSASEYRWDFGDGTSEVSAAPRAEHRYATDRLAAHEERSFRVAVTAVADRDELSATTVVFLKGRPTTHAPTRVDFRIGERDLDADTDGLQLSISVAAKPGETIAWERLDRAVEHYDRSVRVHSYAWTDVVQVDQSTAHGDFSGVLAIDPALITADVYKVVDYLHGRDASGDEVLVTWVAFKRAMPHPELPDDSDDK